MLLLLGIGAATGYGIRAGIAGQSAQDIEALRLQIEQQQQAFEQTRSEAQRELNAMSVKLAELQAESTRINALGARLTRSRGWMTANSTSTNRPPSAVRNAAAPAASVLPPHRMAGSWVARSTRSRSRSRCRPSS